MEEEEEEEEEEGGRGGGRETCHLKTHAPLGRAWVKKHFDGLSPTYLKPPPP